MLTMNITLNLRPTKKKIIISIVCMLLGNVGMYLLQMASITYGIDFPYQPFSIRNILVPIVFLYLLSSLNGKNKLTSQNAPATSVPSSR